MMSRRSLMAVLSGLAGFLAPFRAGAGVPDCRAFAGRWGGTIGAGDGALRLVLDIAADGRPVLVSVDQGGARIPASGGSCQAGRIALDFASVQGRLEVAAEPRPGRPRLSGSWSQGARLPLELVRLDGPEDLPRRPVVVRGPLVQEVPAALALTRASALGAAVWPQAAPEPEAVVAGTRTPPDRGGPADPVLATDLWHIGSVTKAMTGTMLARLVAAGVLDWSLTLEAGLRGAGVSVHPDLKAVTLHQLVTGLSGLATNLPLLEFARFDDTEADPRAARLSWARLALARAPEAAPGSRFIYPNSGFVVAGCLAEQATGLDWEELMRREVFGPLGLASAGFGVPDPARAPRGLAPGLMNAAPRPRQGRQDNPQAMGPAGTVHMSLTDLVTFGRAHALGPGGGAFPGYLPQAAWRVLHTPPPGQGYAVGWLVRPDGSLWHNGSNTLWLCELKVDPQAGHAAAAAANLADSEVAIARALDAAWQQAAGPPEH